MAEQYIGEVRCFALSWAPQGWLPCDGRLLPTSHPVWGPLYAAIGSTYGGDGNTTYALPDLRSRVPVGSGTLDRTAYARGMAGGAEQVTLTEAMLPPHQHLWNASTGPATQPAPANAFLADARAGGRPMNAFTPLYKPVALADDAVASAGGGEPHNNVQPFLALAYYIAYEGTPPQSAPPAGQSGEAGE
jgi:microcystin-dependent protein